jgi:hypothetical protein
VWLEVGLMQQRVALHVGSLLAVVAGALLAATVMLANVARLGSAIASEVNDAQNDYLQIAGSGQQAETNALRLGQCLRREMLKLARGGFVHKDAWAAKSRVQALPLCRNALPPVSPDRALAGVT